eukprot:1176875-Lingulodinium_polyedra.AAC.1
MAATRSLPPRRSRRAILVGGPIRVSAHGSWLSRSATLVETKHASSVLTWLVVRHSSCSFRRRLHASGGS